MDMEVETGVDLERVGKEVESATGLPVGWLIERIDGAPPRLVHIRAQQRRPLCIGEKVRSVQVIDNCLPELAPPCWLRLRREKGQ